MPNYCFVQPIVPGGLAAMKDWVKQGIQGNKGHDSFFRQAGITREQVWVQKTPMGDFAVISFEVQDAGKAFQAIATSKDPWAAQFRALIKKAHGVDVTQPMALNDQVVDWKA